MITYIESIRLSVIKCIKDFGNTDLAKNCDAHYYVVIEGDRKQLSYVGSSFLPDMKYDSVRTKQADKRKEYRQ